MTDDCMCGQPPLVINSGQQHDHNRLSAAPLLPPLLLSSCIGLLGFQ
jgi:hypothetical protein